MQKLAFLFFLLIAHLVSFTQELQLENLTVQDKGSKTVYIAVDNYFKLTNPDYVKAVVPQHGIELKGDSLRIRAYTTGELSIIFLTEKGRENIIFHSKVVSSPISSINGWTDEMVDKSFLLENGQLTIKTFRIDDNFHEGYLITSFVVTINNETFSISGNTFSEKLFAAIRKAKKGDKLIIHNYTAYNETIKKSMKSSGVAYQINE
jgi:aspartate 1-decarboxylase